MSRLPGPTMDDVPGDKPAPGITRVSITEGDISAGGVAVPKGMKNGGMDTSYPTEGRRRSINGSNR